MTAAETPADDDQPPLPSLEVPMEAVPAVVVPRLELAVRVPPPAPEPAPPEPAPTEEAVGEAEPVAGPEPLPEREEADPSALRPEAPEPAPSAVTRPVELVGPADPVPPARQARPVRAARSVRPGELDRRHPVRGLLGLIVVVVFGAIALSLAVGAAIAAVMFAVRGGVGG